MKNLVIGNTSQLAYYFPEDYEKISSRNIELKNERYNKVYICFAEQRTYAKVSRDTFFDVNIDYTLKIINHYSKLSNYIVVYGTSELWNKWNGAIDISLPFDYKPTNYTDSKKQLITEIKDKYDNVIIHHPFNFNSIYRRGEFLFSKIFDSIINEKKITIGNTYFYRELIHPKFVVERSIELNTDEIIGAGRLVFVNDFIRSLYAHFNMIYEDFVIEDYKENITTDERIFYLKSKQVLYNNLYDDTITELEKIKLNK